jgi:hypothetical protein
MKTYISYFFGAIGLFLAPVKGLMIAVGVAIVLDIAFQIYRSVRVKSFRFFSIKNLIEIGARMVLYEISIIGCYIMDFFLLSEISNKLFSIEFMVTKGCAIFLVFLQLVTIKNNFEKATGHDVWALIKNALGRAKEVKDSVTDIIEK